MILFSKTKILKEVIKIVFFSLLPFLCFSQREELRYFISQDSLVRVKNEKGEIIIPAEFDDARMRGLENGQKIEDDLIFFIFHKEKKAKPPKGIGFTYDRKGNFLFHPFWFDNGPDYFSEGLMRIVGENNKVGFADTEGNIVIAPQYDFATPFHYGYADFCNDCRWECTSENNCEHRIVVGGTWGKINRNGMIISSAPKRKHLDNMESRN